MSGVQFDVFLCHNHRDKDAVRAVAEELKSRDVRVFFDEENPRSDGWWSKIDEALLESATCAIVIGDSEIGGIQAREIELALVQQAASAGQERPFGVFVVLLPGAALPDEQAARQRLRFLLLADQVALESLDASDGRAGFGRLVAMVRKERWVEPRERVQPRDRTRNVWTSEFATRPMRRLRRAGTWWMPHVVAMILCIWTLGAWCASRSAHADRLRLQFAVQRAGDEQAALQRSVTFGYFIELNHFWYHALGAPAFVFVGLIFVRTAGDAIAILTAGRRPVVRLGNDDRSGRRAARWLERHNRRVFRWVTPVAVVVALFAILCNELPSFSWKRIGWVQAPRFAAEWQRRAVEDPVVATFQFTGAADDSAMRPDAPRVRNLPDEMSLSSEVLRAVGELGADVAKTGGGAVEVRLTRVDTPYGEPNAVPIGLEVLFLALALGHQWAFYAFVGWLVAKIIFVFLLLLRALSASVGEGSAAALSTPRLNVRLNFADQVAKRFGLGPFDAVYRQAIKAAVIGAIGLVLMVGNSAKDGAFAPQGVTEIFSRASSTIALVLVIAAVVLIPWVAFNDILHKARRSHAKDLAVRAGAAITHQERERVAWEIEMCDAQNAWPAKDFRFVAILIALVLVPIGLAVMLSREGAWIAGALYGL